MGESNAVFEIVIPVTPDDIDGNGHVNNLAYLRWAQEVAAAHWQAFAPAPDRSKLSWIIIRHEIDYKLPAYLGDEVAASTWVGAASRFKFERFTEIRRARDHTLLAKARTIWCAVDVETRRPALVSDELRARFSVPGIHEPPAEDGIPG
ncbi:MAG: acyl-CoA thioesterase [Acidobacteriaceae bacterium]|nr:acyl-CoA thioesterase [Acidobacteriaceae bacterium]